MMPTMTERVIRAQFPVWEEVLVMEPPDLGTGPLVVVGCGTSYYLAQILASVANASGRPAVAVPAAEWQLRPETYLADPDRVRPLVLGLSRSGATTETIAALAASRQRGHATAALTCEPQSPICAAADRAFVLPTDAREGIVMSVSASAMLLAGLRGLGVALPPRLPALARDLMDRMGEVAPPLVQGRDYVVYLGAGPLHGLAREGALKLQEMSLTHAQAFHPMEFRHGPVSLIDGRSLVVLLAAQASAAEEARLSAELGAKGAAVIGFGAPGDLAFDLPADLPDAVRAVAILPALQLLGEIVARSKGLDSTAPRHLTKVVVLDAAP